MNHPLRRLPQIAFHRALLSRLFTFPAIPPPSVPLARRLLITLVVGILATMFGYHQLTGRGARASDFQYDLRAAGQLLQGLDPYNDPTTRYGLPYPFDAQFPYPLFAAMLAVPFTPFPDYSAGALYVGCLAGLMAFAVTRNGLWRLVIFLSPSYFVTASVANWSPLLIASAFLPALYPLAIVKPTLALPLMLNRPNWRGFLLCLPMTALSLAIMPDWPLRWLSSVINQPSGKYLMPILFPPGLLLIVTLLWWRKRSARLLFLFSLIPQHPFFYDQLLLWLIPQTLRQSLTLSGLGWLAYFGWFWVDSGDPLLALTPHGPSLQWIVPTFYMPALCLVAWQVFLGWQVERANLLDGLVPQVSTKQ